MALRTRCTSGPRSCSSTRRSSDTSAPTTLSRTSLPVAWHRSRTARRSGSSTVRTGMVEMAFRPSSMVATMSAASSLSDPSARRSPRSMARVSAVSAVAVKPPWWRRSSSRRRTSRKRSTSCMRAITCRVETRQLVPSAVCGSSGTSDGLSAAGDGPSAAGDGTSGAGDGELSAAFGWAMPGLTRSSSSKAGRRSGSSVLAAVARRLAIQVSSPRRTASASGAGSGCAEPRSGRITSSMRCAKSASSSRPSVAELPLSVCRPRATSSKRGPCAGSFSSSMRLRVTRS